MNILLVYIYLLLGHVVFVFSLQIDLVVDVGHATRRFRCSSELINLLVEYALRYCEYWR